MAYIDRDRQNAYNRAHYARNKDYYYAKAKRSKDELRQMVITAKDRPCMDCGVRYPHYVMDLDHREGEDKVDVVSQLVLRGGKKRLIAEIAKCDVVCANCHRERTMSRLRSSDG